MPTEAENIQYLYLVLTSDGTPTIDWDAVGAALDLNKGAVTKRWSRLKQSMENGESPGGSTYQFLWLCVKHSKRTTAMNWTKIAEKCNTTSGAAAKRYSRMKQAFDQGAAPPGASASRSPAKNTPTKAKTTPKSTPRKSKAATSSGDDQVAATPTPKRKRATPLKKMAAAEAQTFKADPEDEDDANVSDEEHTPKRAKGTKGKAKTNGAVIDKKQKDTELLTPTTEATTIIKGEHDEGDGDNDEDTFYDAHERVEDLADTDVDADARLHDWLCSSG